MSDQPAPSIPIEKTANAIIARPQTKMMDDDALKSLAHAIDQATAADTNIQLVILDLSLVQLLPSLALGVLVQLSSKCKARQQKLKLAAAQPGVRQVFAITRLDRVFEFSPSVEAALE